jgi:diaminopimelate decarboxylase
MRRPVVPNALVREVAETYGTPCWVYDAECIRDRVRRLHRFKTIRYAQKANSNIHILSLLREMGVVVDAVSTGEIDRALAAGFRPEGRPAGIVYASDILDHQALARVIELRIPVNVGSPQMLEQVGRISPNHPVWIRINPGFGSGFSRKTNTGGENSKHGIWHERLDETYNLVRSSGLALEGLHMHIGSGADFDQLRRVCDAMVEHVRRCPFDLKTISAGGGLPAPYRDTDDDFDVDRYFDLWASAVAEIEAIVGHEVSFEVEPGRFLVANAGCLISEVRAKKQVGTNNFILVDAGFNELMRPAMYGSFHQIEIVPASGSSTNGHRQTVVAGPLCEAGDVFTQEPGGLVNTQDIPDPVVGDWAVFRDCGAYSASMSSNYNSRPLAAEVLFEAGKHRLIRKRQDYADILALDLV